MDAHGFLGGLGVIDCRHTSLHSPLAHGLTYVNRKGFHSISVQVIVRFAGWLSWLYTWLKSRCSCSPPGCCTVQWMPVRRPWLSDTYLAYPAILYANDSVAIESCLLSARSVMEWTSGLLKMRLRCFWQVKWHITIHPSGSQCLLHGMLCFIQYWISDGKTFHWIH